MMNSDMNKPSAPKSVSRLPVLSSFKSKRLRSNENLPVLEKKRLRLSSPEQAVQRRAPATIACTKPKQQTVAVAPQAAEVPYTGGKKPRAAWDLKGKVDDMREQVSHYKSKVQVLTSENAELQQTVEVAHGQLALLREENQKQTTRCSTLSTELLMTQEKLTQTVVDRASLSTLVSSQEGQISAHMKTIAQLQEAKNNLMSLADSMEVKLKLTAEELSLKRELLEKLRSEDITLREEGASKDERLHGLEMERRRLHNIILELKGNIRVFCRVRPLLKSESNYNMQHIQFPQQDDKGVILCRTEDSHTGRERREAHKYDFTFDRVFQPASCQDEVFDEISLLVQSALDGYHVCIFAYGQTGSGKTYTMEGPDYMDYVTMGMIPRAVRKIFQGADELKAKGWTYTFTANFLEIYNESIRDLLVNKPEKNIDYDIKRVSSTSDELYVTNLRYVQVSTEEEVHNILRTAKTNRSVAKTAINDHSSRSHSVFQLKIEGRNTTRDLKTTSILSLIDLAGSERLDKSASKGDRLRETQAINTSLSNLGLVIASLSNKDSHIPYRNSKLTYLLQNSLGGNSKVLMFVNVSPLDDNFSESLNSLRFASKVNECVIGTAQANRKWKDTV